MREQIPALAHFYRCSPAELRNTPVREYAELLAYAVAWTERQRQAAADARGDG